MSKWNAASEPPKFRTFSSLIDLFFAFDSFIPQNSFSDYTLLFAKFFFEVFILGNDEGVYFS